MEVVLLASAISQLALRLCDKYASNFAMKTRTEARVPDRTPISASPPVKSDTLPLEEDLPEDASIPMLELRVKQLRSHARSLNSRDTFVEYARVSREANKVEMRLNERRALETDHESGSTIETIAHLLPKVFGTTTTSILERKGHQLAIKFIIRVMVFFGLWWYFSWNRYTDHGSVMVIDCRAVRPLAFFLKKTMPLCPEGDWVCAGGASKCHIPFTLAFGMCNVVLAMIAKAFT